MSVRCESKRVLHPSETVFTDSLRKTARPVCCPVHNAVTPRENSGQAPEHCQIPLFQKQRLSGCAASRFILTLADCIVENTRSPEKGDFVCALQKPGSGSARLLQKGWKQSRKSKKCRQSAEKSNSGKRKDRKRQRPDAKHAQRYRTDK